MKTLTQMAEEFGNALRRPNLIARTSALNQDAVAVVSICLAVYTEHLQQFPRILQHLQPAAEPCLRCVIEGLNAVFESFAGQHICSLQSVLHLG